MRCYICGQDAIFTCKECGRSGCYEDYMRGKELPAYDNKYKKDFCPKCYGEIYREITEQKGTRCINCNKVLHSTRTAVGKYMKVHPDTSYGNYPSDVSRRDLVDEWFDFGYVCSEACKNQTEYTTPLEAANKIRRDEYIKIFRLIMILFLSVLLGGFACYLLTI